MSKYTSGINFDRDDANDTLPDLAVVDGAIRPRNSAAFAVFAQGQPESRATCVASLASPLSELRVPAAAGGVRLCVGTSAGRQALVEILRLNVILGNETELLDAAMEARLWRLNLPT